jgi:hypothetical protein
VAKSPFLQPNFTSPNLNPTLAKPSIILILAREN